MAAVGWAALYFGFFFFLCILNKQTQVFLMSELQITLLGIGYWGKNQQVEHIIGAQ